MIDIDTTLSIYEYPVLFKNTYLKNKFKLRREFSNLIDKISDDNKSNIDWWVSNIAERNLNSQLFHKICIYFSLRELIKKKKVNKIIIDDKNLYECIREQFKREIILKIKKKIFFVRILNTLFNHFIIYLYVQIFKKKKTYNNAIDIVDRFYTDINIQFDRYYNNYFDNKKFMYLPTFVGLNFIKTIRCIKKMNNDKFILKQNYFSIYDLFYSFGYLYRKNSLIKKRYKFKNLDVTKILKSELKNLENLNASIIGIQNFILIKNFKKLNLKVNKFINWFENSNVDKGYNLGFTKFLPEASTLGYQGFFVEKEWMHLDPSPKEFKYKVIPKKIICINSKLIPSRKEFCNKINVVKGINLRFKKKFKINYKKKYNDSILLVLNINRINCMMILKEILKTDFCKSGKKIFLKEHPLLKLSDFFKFSLPSNIKIVNDSYDSLVKKFKVIISSGSSSSIIESILAKCNIIFPFNNHFDKYNMEQLKISKKIYKSCKNTKELDKAINFFLKRKKNVVNKSIINSVINFGEKNSGNKYFLK